MYYLNILVLRLAFSLRNILKVCRTLIAIVSPIEQTDLLMRLKTEINAWDKVAERHPYSVYRKDTPPAFSQARKDDPFTTSFGEGLPFRTYDRNQRARLCSSCVSNDGAAISTWVHGPRRWHSTCSRPDVWAASSRCHQPRSLR